MVNLEKIKYLYKNCLKPSTECFYCSGSRIFSCELHDMIQTRGWQVTDYSGGSDFKVPDKSVVNDLQVPDQG